MEVGRRGDEGKGYEAEQLDGVEGDGALSITGMSASGSTRRGSCVGCGSGVVVAHSLLAGLDHLGAEVGHGGQGRGL